MLQLWKLSIFKILYFVGENLVNPFNMDVLL